MPHRWADASEADEPVLTLWPHRSLPHRGFAAIVLFAFTAGTIPLYGLIGTVLFWGILPFILLMVWGLWYGLRKSYKDGDVFEALSLAADTLHLSHKPASGTASEWSCNIYWARTQMHVHGGPVPHYVTLSGNGRTVEIGSFLTEDERKTLYVELSDFLADRAATQQ
ncbi:DUF2244 domain-containing protein [Shimia sp. R10_1]|uniref:DUF2244 domain-containing protein n=1 Tax=Shimia sp. R10_1 TaxID=2821095 RepID=UPI001ADA17F4|nr:DUF2244 domain-containing protein [Shimia sp. R10_1]MBO9474799.1 DUF2244 domain-containing protein [Shimia sp. R10_1]